MTLSRTFAPRLPETVYRLFLSTPAFAIELVETAPGAPRLSSRYLIAYQLGLAISIPAELGFFQKNLSGLNRGMTLLRMSLFTPLLALAAKMLQTTANPGIHSGPLKSANSLLGDKIGVPVKGVEAR